MGDVRNVDPQQEGLPAFYFPYGYIGMPGLLVVVRTATAPDGLAKTVRAQVTQIDPDQPGPFWKNLLNEMSDKNVRFYVISVDRDQAKAQSFAETYGFEDLPVLFDPQREALTSFKIQFVPQYVLLTSSGEVIMRWNGIRRYDPDRHNATEKIDGLRELLSNSARFTEVMMKK